MAECKKCLLYEAAEKDVYESVQAAIGKIKENEKASKEEYLSRLEKCKNCEHLISGVCMKCGCYVELRAAFKKQNCPNAKNRKW